MDANNPITKPDMIKVSTWSWLVTCTYESAKFTAMFPRQPYVRVTLRQCVLVCRHPATIVNQTIGRTRVISSMVT